ncbi:hypothetical protein RYX41_18430 [Lactiplantibacillus plantarum]|nr:hypothetical protein [Lactiplantibacillus plantarum]
MGSKEAKVEFSSSVDADVQNEDATTVKSSGDVLKVAKTDNEAEVIAETKPNDLNTTIYGWCFINSESADQTDVSADETILANTTLHKTIIQKRTVVVIT